METTSGIDKAVMQEIMYDIIAELSKSKYKFVFKGALLLSALQKEAGITTPSRLSRDFDADAQEPITVDAAKSELERALKTVGVDNAVVEVESRTSNEQFYFDIRDEQGALMFGVDIGTKINPWHTSYQLQNGTIIYGQTISKIFWDKIAAVSTPIVDRRPWDVFDLYVLSMRHDLRISKILQVRDGTGRTLGDWQAFLYPSDKLKSTWKRRRYIVDRPEFNTMFGRARDICMPFITEWEGTKGTWKPKEGFWYEGEYD